MKGNPIRIWFPFGTEYFVESNYVLIADERSLQPVAGQPAMRHPSIIFEAVQKGLASIDYDMAIPPNSNSKKRSAKLGGSKSNGTGVRGVEFQQIQFTMTDAIDDVGYARVGWTPLTGLMDSSLVKGANTVMGGGKYTTAILTYFQYLLQYGTFRITKLKFNGSADSVFDQVAPTYKKFSALGTVVEDKILEYPTANSVDQDSTIRELDEKAIADEGLELVFDGMSYLQLAVNKAQTLAVTMWFEYTPNA